MSLLVLVVVVLVILALVMWAIYYIPLPPGSPTFIKPLLYVIVLLIAVVVIVQRVGLP